jgi:pimeloyl-ACP methyl ester carboxylesterase
MGIEKFSLPFSPSAVEDLRQRLRGTRWPDEIAGSDWEYGFSLQFLQELCEYWGSQFDWKSQLDKLSKLPHFLYTSAADFGIHFLHVRGKGPAPIPLILTHGWPGSFLEMLRIIPLLTDPGSNGGDPGTSFDVVVPSLPGYGYSDRPARRGMNVFRIADLWVELMSELGYRKFGAQGGDIGAGVSTALGLRHADHLLGIHLNFLPGSFQPFLRPSDVLTPAEKAFLEEVARWSEFNGAYSHIQRTRPQTLAYGLNDSPSGLAAWILEKFREWSDCAGDVYRRFSRDELLTNVTLYWMTEKIHSSFRLYYENSKSPLRFGPADFVQVPCAFARFPKELSAPPRTWVERGYNVQRWSEMLRGGHFAAAEEPELLAEDIRAFFGGLSIR